MLATVRRVEVPDRFSNELLKRLGFTSSNDRPFIRVLKAIRFLDDAGTPTQRYKDFRDASRGDAVLAEALRDAYADIFFQHPEAQGLTNANLTAIFQRESGKSERVAQQMAATFKAFADQADWTGAEETAGGREQQREDVADAETNDENSGGPAPAHSGALSLRHEVHVHLPSTTDPAVYDAIFRSLREHLL